METRHAEVSGIRVENGGIEFRYSPKSLPFPDFDSWREPLRVTGLSEGFWELRAASERLGVFKASEFEAGVDLARLETPSVEN